MELTTTLACKPAHSHRRPKLALALLSLAVLSGCGTLPLHSPKASDIAVPAGMSPTNRFQQASALPLPPPAAPVLVATGKTITGVASWYSVGCGGGHRTCTGEEFTGDAMTAASHTIPLGTRVRVALVDDPSRFIVVRVDDYMPRRGRVLDLSRAAAQQLGMLSAGVARVSVEPVVEVADNTP